MTAERVSHTGKCSDCLQGVAMRVHTGFAMYSEDGEDQFWYCRYCGSNHVDVPEVKDSLGPEDEPNGRYDHYGRYLTWT